MVTSAYFIVKKGGICTTQWSLPKSHKSRYCLNVQVGPLVFLPMVKAEGFPPG